MALAGNGVDDRPEAVDDAPKVPFSRASQPYNENFFTLPATTLGAAQFDSQPYNIPPGGFLRGVKLIVTSAAGVLGPATLAADWPWNVFQYIVLEDVNGNPIIGPLPGYTWYLINKYGGYRFLGDPGVKTGFSGGVNPSFTLWLPLEFRSDGLGSLANTDARAQYRVRFGLIPALTGTGTTVWTTPPNIAVKGMVHTWAQVEPLSLDKEPQEQVPPGLGSTQFWTQEAPVVAAGEQYMKHNKAGNLIRNVGYMTRTAAAQAATTQASPRSDLLQDPIRIRLDSKYLKVDAIADRIDEMASRYELTVIASGSARDTGVYWYPWSDGPDTHPSPADDSNYLPTTEATLLQLENNFSAAGTLTIITNDIAPYGDFAASPGV